MKLKKDFVIYNMDDDYMLIPTGDQMGTFGGTVVLNEVSAFILNQMKEAHKTEAQLTEAILAEYEVAPEVAARDVAGAVQTFKEMGVIED